MFRVTAPSQVLKRRSDHYYSDNDETFQPNKRLSLSINTFEGIGRPSNTKKKNESDKENLSHEDLIAQILCQPFKIPIKGYQGSSYGRSLGLKRSGIKRALHDPFADNALIVYEPKEYSEHQKLQMKPDDIEVHVVVDPNLTAILR